MLNRIIFFSIVLCVMCMNTNSVFADELFIPSDMLISGDYHGVFIRDDSKLSQLITLASNSDIIDIPDALFFAPDQNHATFDITLHGIGEGIIIARTDESFYNVTTSIHSDQKKDYNIFLLFPEKTSTSDVQGMVFLVDDFFNPIYADEDVFVKFATQNIDVPKQLRIAAGNSYAFFSANIRGDGTITAHTDKSISNSLHVDYFMAQKNVHIGVAPDVIAPYSSAYLFVWLTENETPLEPILPIKSTLHVSDGHIPSAGESGIHKKQVCISSLSCYTTGTGAGKSGTVYLREGFLMKKIITNDPGEYSITINVPGFGITSKTVNVIDVSVSEEDIIVQALLDGCDVDLIGAGYTGCDSEYLHPTSRVQYIRDLKSVDTPDTIVANIFPTVTSESAYLVWSLYRDVNSELIPMYGDVGTDFSISSQYLIHDDTVQFQNDERRTQSQIIPISSSIIGDHTVSVSSTTTMDIATAELKIAAPAQYSISIQSLPSLDATIYRPLFAVSVMDSDGYVVNPHSVFGDLQVALLSDDVEFVQKSIYLDQAVNIVNGKSVVAYPSVTILANDRDIITSNSYRPTSGFDIDIQMPKMVHSGEEFPAYVFLTDGEKPVSDISKYIQTKCDDQGKLFSCLVDSEFILFENAIGFATKTVGVFENQFEPDDISFSLGNSSSPIGVGSKFLIDFEIPSDATLDVVTSIPYVSDDSTVTLQPDFTGQHDVSFLVSKPGFETYGINASYLVNDSIHLTINTVSLNGVSIPSSVSISRAGETTNVPTPGTADIPRGDMHFEFESLITIDSTGYSFDHVVMSDIPYDSPIIDVRLMTPTDISVIYGQVINIVVSNAQGGGLYDYGESVTLYAPPHDVVSFLIRDVFDYWNYLPVGYDVYSQTITLPATESFTTNAVYKQDFSGIVLSVVFAVFLLFAFTRRNKLVSIYRTYRK